MKKYIILLLLICFVSCNNNGEDPIPPKPLIINKSDSIAIWNLYKSIKQPSAYKWDPNDRNTLRGIAFLLDSANNELRVTWLILQDIKAQLPQDYTKLPYLTYLELYGDGITGEIAQDFDNLKYVIQIHIVSTSLRGNFPNSVFQQRNNKFLTIASNKYITGELPEDITDFMRYNFNEITQGFYVDLSNNSLYGRIPAARFSNFYTSFTFRDNNFTDVPKNYWSDLSLWTVRVCLKIFRGYFPTCFSPIIRRFIGINRG